MKCLAQKHDALPRPGLEPRSFDPESSALHNPKYNTVYFTQEFTTSMFLRQEWIDIRLAHGEKGTLPVKGKELQKIWRPDTYFTNNNDYKLYEDNQLALISKFGYVYYSAR